MSKRHTLIAVVAMWCGAALAGKVGGTDALLDRLAGKWVLSGTLAGKETTHDITAEWILNHGYLRLHEVSREKNSSGAPAYEAIVFISHEAKTEDYTALWLDTTSNEGLNAQGFGHAKPNGNSLQFVWRDAAGQVSFENAFVYDSGSDSWKWVLDNVNAGKRKPFGRVTLVKAAP